MMMRLLAALALLAVAACDSGSSGTTTTFPAEGDIYPAATVEDCNGVATPISGVIASHDVTFITYGATWCVACQKEAKRLNEELFDVYGANVAVVQILVEDQPGDPPPVSLCAAWRDELGARYTVLVDVDQETLPQHFGVAIQTLPLHFIVTKDGTIRFRKLGDLPTNIAQLVQDWLPAQ